MKNRPDKFDLQWECLRRSPDYKQAYKDHKEALKNPVQRIEVEALNKSTGKLEKRVHEFPVKDPTRLIARFKINRIISSSKAWDQIKSPPCKLYPMHKKIKADIVLPYEDCSDPVQTFSFKTKEQTEIIDQYRDRYLWLRIDPFANKTEIKKMITEMIDRCGVDSDDRNRIDPRMEWLKIVDRIERKKIKPYGLRDHVKKMYRQKDPDYIMIRYAWGKLLIEDPSNPLEKLENNVAWDYLKRNELIPRKEK